jgi:hypothetical protein
MSLDSNPTFAIRGFIYHFWKFKYHDLQGHDSEIWFVGAPHGAQNHVIEYEYKVALVLMLILNFLSFYSTNCILALSNSSSSILSTNLSLCTGMVFSGIHCLISNLLPLDCAC